MTTISRKMRRYDASLGAPPQPNGEPEWMPSPADVERARSRLERYGVAQALVSARDVAPLATPGEVPWAWWATAALWLLVWPAVFVWRWRSDALDWLPVWLLGALALVHMLALAVPVLYSERISSRGALRRRFARVDALPEVMALEPAAFEAWTAMLFQLLGYRVTNTPDVGDHGIDLVVANDQIRRGLVQCKRYRGTVGEGTVRDLYGTMVHENADYAWLVTTGGVSRQAREWAEGKPIALWDGQQLIEMAHRYH
jgi:restriction system protein